jgi:hypothetical protein
LNLAPSSLRLSGPSGVLLIGPVTENDDSMEKREFQEELERIRLDIESFARPFSACEYFHGREKLFGDDQFKEAIVFFLESQQEKFEG